MKKVISNLSIENVISYGVLAFVLTMWSMLVYHIITKGVSDSLSFGIMG